MKYSKIFYQYLTLIPKSQYSIFQFIVAEIANSVNNIEDPVIENVIIFGFSIVFASSN